MPTIIPAIDEARLVDRHRQPEVAEFGGAVLGQPDVAGLEVAVDDAVLVGIGQRLADLVGDAQRVGQRRAMLGSGGDQPFDVAAGHQFG